MKLLENLKLRFKMLDKWIAIPFLAMIFLSVIAVYSASSYSALKDYGNPNHYLVRQSINVMISLAVASFVYIFPFRALKNKRFVILGTFAVLLLLLAVFAFPEIQGARRWIPLPFFNLQPAEFAKVFVVWYLAYILSRNQEGLQQNFRQTIIPPAVLVAVITMLILFEPDTGTAIITILMVVLIVSGSGASLKYAFTFIGLGVIVGGGLYYLVYKYGENIPVLGYRYNRFLGVFDPFGYYESHGHQLVNSYYALNRGGLFGVGIGNSVQKTGYLPFPYTDFIIAIIGEELGLMGITFVLGSLGTIIGRSFYIASKANDSFNSILCLGVGAMLLIQSMTNLAGLTGLIPITGVTFPLMSYGGSSIIAVSISIALVANASTLERLKEDSRL